jgi:hypothetical protein
MRQPTNGLIAAEDAMDDISFDRLTVRLRRLVSRRATVGGLGALILPSLVHAKKKRKKRKKKCAKAGQKPGKQRKKCCSRLIKDGTGVCAAACTPATCAAANLCVDGTCQPCDVCQDGCFFSSVQAAINAAAQGETIRICPGLYPGDVTIGKNLTLIGAGDGLGAGNTILQGSGTAPVVAFADNTPPVTMRGLRITGGKSPYGGGIYNAVNAAETVTLIDCTVSGNTATGASGGGGGGIFIDFGTLQLTGCTVSGNQTDNLGGGIYVNGATLSLTNSTIAGNTAKYGGGICVFESSGKVTLDAASRVTGNAADPTDPNNGGGILNATGTVTLSSADNVTGNTPDNCSGTVPLCSD